MAMLYDRRIRCCNSRSGDVPGSSPSDIAFEDIKEGCHTSKSSIQPPASFHPFKSPESQESKYSPPLSTHDNPTIPHRTYQTSKMKASILPAAVTILASNVLAAPTSIQASPRQFQAQLTFTGSDTSQSYSISVPTTPESTFEISEPLFYLYNCHK